MKSRSSSPQTSPQVVRRYRVDSNKEGATAPSSLRKPSLRIEELPKPTMNSLSPLNTSVNGRESSPQTELLRPIPHGVRRVSGDITPSRPALNGYLSSSSINNAGTPSPAGTENESPSWSSAVGHATTAGKSGRVIEKLMADNDRMRRDLEIANMKRQELQKSLDMYKPQMDALKAEVENLTHTKGVDESMISRKERRIEELKADNAAKTERTQRAEALVRQQQRQMEEMREDFTREQQGMVEQTKHATVHAEILETSHKQLSAEYRARREAWERDLVQIQEEREVDRQRMSRLDVVYEQMRQEHERTRKVQADLAARWAEMETAMRSTVQEGDEVHERVRKKSSDMETVVNEMRWVMGLQKSGAFRKDSKEDAEVPTAR